MKVRYEFGRDVKCITSPTHVLYQPNISILFYMPFYFHGPTIFPYICGAPLTLPHLTSLYSYRSLSLACSLSSSPSSFFSRLVSLCIFVSRLCTLCYLSRYYALFVLQLFAFCLEIRLHLPFVSMLGPFYSLLFVLKFFGDLFQCQGVFVLCFKIKHLRCF